LLEGWINGVQRLNYPNLQFAPSAATADTILIATTWNCIITGGGACNPNGQPSDVHGNMWRYTANMVGSRARIGCLGTITPPSPIPSAPGAPVLK
jgi:hypothetical protein